MTVNTFSSVNFLDLFDTIPKMRSSVTRVTRLSIKFMYAAGKIMCSLVFFLSTPQHFYFKYIKYEEHNVNNKYVDSEIWWMSSLSYKVLFIA